MLISSGKGTRDWGWGSCFVGWAVCGVGGRGGGGDAEARQGKRKGTPSTKATEAVAAWGRGGVGEVILRKHADDVVWACGPCMLPVVL